MAGWEAESSQVEAIIAGRHDNPFGVLGLQNVGGQWVARAFIPYAERVEVFNLVGDAVGELQKRHPAGFFEGLVNVASRQPIRYHASNPGGE